MPDSWNGDFGGTRCCLGGSFSKSSASSPTYSSSSQGDLIRLLLSVCVSSAEGCLSSRTAGESRVLIGEPKRSGCGLGLLAVARADWAGV